MSTNIELSKTRDFGEIISDSFLFIRENLKPLLTCFFTFCGFFMLATIVLSYLEQTKMLGAMNTLGGDPNSFDTQTGPFAVFSRLLGVEYLFLIFFMFLNWTTMVVTVISYMAVYKAKGNIPPTTVEVWGYIKYYFFKIMGTIILTGISTALGFVCCILPGIWLYPILALIVPIIIIENTSFGYAFSQSFRIIKENWWATFGALFVIGLIASILVSVIVMPFGAANILTTFLHPNKGIHLNPTLTFISSVVNEIGHVFYILPLVTLTLCYFNLTELKDATGLMDRINKLGNNDADNTNLPVEEY